MSTRINCPYPAHRPLVLAIAVACASLSGLAVWAPAAQAQQSGARSYDIPAGPLTGALNRFAEVSGIYLVGNAELTSSRSSAGLRGSYSVEAGLNALLQGSGVEAAIQPNGSYALRKTETTLRAVNVRDKADVQRDELPPTYAGGQVARGGRLGLLGNRNMLDTPFNLTSYTAQTIVDQQARSIADILVNDPSAQLSSARTNIGEEFALRGFPMASQDIALNGMYGLMPYFRVPVEMAERVEVLKGPGALLSGMAPSGNIAGAVNVVSKRASAEPMTRVGVSYMSDSVLGTQVDIGRRFGGQQEFGVRFNGAYRDGDIPVDEQELEEAVGSLGLDYTAEKLRITADFIYQRETIDAVVRQFTMGAALTDIPDAPDNDINYPGYGYSEMRDNTWVLRGEYDINEHLTVYAGYGDRNSKMNALAGNPTLDTNAGDFSSAPAWQVFSISSHSAEAGLHAVFTTGAIEHQVTASATRLIQNQDIYFLLGAFGAYTSNLSNPTYPDIPGTDGYSGNALKYKNAELTSYAVADTLSFLDGRFDLTLGARRQQVEEKNHVANFQSPLGAFYPNVGDVESAYDEHATTPVVGVVVKPRENISLYANYIEGLSQGPAVPIGTPMVGTVTPIKTKQREVGVKADWGTLVTTASLFEIKKPNAFAENGRVGLNGEQRNRGLELNVFGELAAGVRLLGGGSYLDAELTETAGGQFDGNDAVAVPRQQINLGGEWDTGVVPGLTLTARAIYTGKQYLDQANQLDIPDWTRIDIGARYTVTAFAKPLVLRANIDNLFDKDYWSASNFGYLYVGMPRTLQLSATVDF